MRAARSDFGDSGRVGKGNPATSTAHTLKQACSRLSCHSQGTVKRTRSILQIGCESGNSRSGRRRLVARLPRHLLARVPQERPVELGLSRLEHVLEPAGRDDAVSWIRRADTEGELRTHASAVASSTSISPLLLLMSVETYPARRGRRERVSVRRQGAACRRRRAERLTGVELGARAMEEEKRDDGEGEGGRRGERKGAEREGAERKGRSGKGRKGKGHRMSATGTAKEIDERKARDAP